MVVVARQELAAVPALPAIVPPCPAIRAAFGAALGTQLAGAFLTDQFPARRTAFGSTKRPSFGAAIGTQLAGAFGADRFTTLEAPVCPAVLAAINPPFGSQILAPVDSPVGTAVLAPVNPTVGATVLTPFGPARATFLTPISIHDVRIGKDFGSAMRSNV